MDPIERLLAVQACQDLLLQAAACADANDADALSQLFSEDAQLLRPGAELLSGREAIRAAYAQRSPDRISRHLLSNMRVDIESPNRARVHSQVLLWTGSRTDEQTPQGRPAQGRQLLGEFKDELLRDAQGRWLIQRRDAYFVLYRDA